MNNPNKASLLHLLFWTVQIAIPVILPASLAHASCTGDSNLRTCNLYGEHSIRYETVRKYISFTLLSNNANQAQPFTLKVTPATGSHFRLYSDSGEPLDIDLSLSYRNHYSTPLLPNKTSDQLSGSLSDLNSKLNISVNSSTEILSTNYRGSFQMELVQYMNATPIDSHTVDFTIALEVEPSISINNLGNIYINGSNFPPGQDITGYEDFCVQGIGFSSYQVSLSSRNSLARTAQRASMFLLSSPVENLPYAVSFTDDMSQTSGAKTLSNGIALGTLTESLSGHCAIDNARIMVTIPGGVWEGAKSSYYTDVLTVTVTGQ
ncbi:hypothetical protein ACJJIF_10695 [Microbulbifer sp. SSSA002]|uniref:hypothetical protein n=1 Tax=unclassified Microbulbifer TaxID=2619833 RepID=UPI004039A0CD